VTPLIYQFQTPTSD
jgi:hypothetical protein